MGLPSLVSETWEFRSCLERRVLRYQASSSSPEVEERKATGAAQGSGKSPEHWMDSGPVALATSSACSASRRTTAGETASAGGTMSNIQTLYNRIEPELPEARCSFFERGCVLLSRVPQAGRGDARMVQFTGVADVPALQAGGGDFGM